MFLEVQKHKSHNENTKETKHTFHARLVNLAHVKFSNDQINTLNLGFDYALEKNPKQFIKTVIIDTENDIRHLNIRIQNTFSYLTTRKIKQIADTGICNTLYKRHQYNRKQIKTIIEQNNLT